MTTGRILVTGATGTIGSKLVPLLATMRHEVRALVRDAHKAKALGPGIEIAVGDLTQPATLAPALTGVDKLFVISNGFNIAELEGNLYEAVRGTDIRHVVKLSGRHVDADFMRDTPLAINQTAAETHLTSLGVPWTIIRPAFFASNLLQWTDRTRRMIALPVGDGQDVPTDPEDVAAVGYETLTGAGHEGQIYEISGPAFLSFAAMTARIAEATGKPLALVDVPPEAAYQGMVAAGVPATQARGLLTYFEAVRAGRIYPPSDTIQTLLGRPPRSFDDWVAANRPQLAA